MSKVAGQRGVDHGAGTVLADDPALSVRDASIAPHLPEAWVTRPRPVFVLDASGRVPRSAKLWPTLKQGEACQRHDG